MEDFQKATPQIYRSSEEERGQGPALLLFDLPEVVQCLFDLLLQAVQCLRFHVHCPPPCVLFFTDFFSRHIWALPSLSVTGVIRSRQVWNAAVWFSFPSEKTLKTSPFDAVVLLQSSKIVILRNCLTGDSVDYCVENVDAYLRALLDRISRHMWQLVKHARGQDWRYLSHSEDFDLRAQAQAELLAGKRDSPGCEVGMGGLVRRRGGNPSLFTVPAS